MLKASPLVSIVTPVYNGETYIAECVDSIVSQTYVNWEYTLVDNCSTDRTLEIARDYQARDHRIAVIANRQFVGPVENHNLAIRSISPDSKYCKVVSADDWLYPECLARLVELGESASSAGVLQAYVINSAGVRQTGIPVRKSILDGRAVARDYLLGNVEFAGIPTANLYRASFVRLTSPFFPGSRPDADAAACLRCLQNCDFGIVHQILSFERLHEKQLTSKVRDLSGYILDRVELLLEYGPIFLTSEEMVPRVEALLEEYYRTLAAASVNCRSVEFWAYHKERLASLGLRLYGSRFCKALMSKVLDLLLNPKQTVEKVVDRAFRYSNSGSGLPTTHSRFAMRG